MRFFLAYYDRFSIFGLLLFLQEHVSLPWGTLDLRTVPLSQSQKMLIRISKIFRVCQWRIQDFMLWLTFHTSTHFPHWQSFVFREFLCWVRWLVSVIARLSLTNCFLYIDRKLYVWIQCKLWSLCIIAHERRQFLVAMLPGIKKLNGGAPISMEEREDAERAFIRRFAQNQKDISPPKRLALALYSCKIHTFHRRTFSRMWLKSGETF